MDGRALRRSRREDMALGVRCSTQVAFQYLLRLSISRNDSIKVPLIAAAMFLLVTLHNHPFFDL
jgi:hypothetical protein